jgi:AcrR family transcriptional regulator
MKLKTDSGAGARVRESAEERREQILAAAIDEFAARGLRGASMEDVAGRVGVSQPYVYKLFGTKKGLFLAAMRPVCDRVLAAFREAAEAEPEDALAAMGRAYDRSRFGREERLMLLQGFAAADDLEVRDAVAESYAELWRFVQEASGGSDEEIFRFFATGMLLTVDAAIGFLARLGRQGQQEERAVTGAQGGRSPFLRFLVSD